MRFNTSSSVCNFVDIQHNFTFAGTFLPSSYSRHVQFYRKDYTYIQDFDAFYKVHWNVSGSFWKDAFLACGNEGATLFFPKARREWTVVKNLTDKMKENMNVKEIFVGLHDEFKLGEFLTVDGEYLELDNVNCHLKFC